MDGQLTVGRFDDGGKFIDVDLRALRKAATPRWSPTAMVRVRAHLNQCRRRHPLTPAPRRT